MPSWLIFAIGSAFFAAITTILAKIGIKGIDSNLATAIRTVVITVFAWGLVFLQGTTKDLAKIDRFSLLFLVLSGVATGLSWLCYFKALQIGDVAKVAPVDKLSLVLAMVMALVFLQEKITLTTWLGGGLIAAGVLVISLAH